MKPATAKRKGAQTEVAAVEWLQAHGFPYAERRHLNGTHDKGDIAGVPGVCIEVKSAASWTPLRWLAELEVEVANAGAEVGFVLARPKGRPAVEDWAVIVTPAQMIELLTAAGWAAPENVNTSNTSNPERFNHE